MRRRFLVYLCLIVGASSAIGCVPNSWFSVRLSNTSGGTAVRLSGSVNTNPITGTFSFTLR